MSAKIVSDTLAKYRSDILSGELPFGTLLPTEKELGVQLGVSRPTIAKIYNALKKEGLLKKTQGQGTTVVYNGSQEADTFGLLLPGAGESEIFGAIHDHFLSIEKENKVKFLWDGAIGNDAEVRQNSILRISERYLDEHIKGVFFAPLERTENANTINHQVCDFFDTRNIPVVLIDRDILTLPARSKYPVVSVDNFSAGYIMTKHLIESGCNKIYFFYRKGSANSINKRITGCTSACFDSEIQFNKKCIFVGDPSDASLIKQMKILPGKTGILCANDSTAAVVMSTLNRIGITVSQDVLVAGFDDMKYGKVLQPSLTTYRQPLLEIVNSSYNLMVNMPNKSLPADITLTGELVSRESTKFL